MSNNLPPTRAAVFVNLANMFNSFSHHLFFQVIAESFPEILPVATLFYKQAGTVHHTWADRTWITLLMEEGVSQGCPLTHICIPCYCRITWTSGPPPQTVSYRTAPLRWSWWWWQRGCHTSPWLHWWFISMHTIRQPPIPLQTIRLAWFPTWMLCQPYENKNTHIHLQHIIPRRYPPLQSHLATSIECTISAYLMKPNITLPTGPPLPVELTIECRLLGSPIRSASFAKHYFNKQLNQVQQYISLMTTAILDPQTRLWILSQCLIQKLPHLLGSDVLHHYDTSNLPPIWTDWNSPLTSATNQIIDSFLAKL